MNELRRLGYDVLTSYEAGNANPRIADDRVLVTATEGDRCVLTFNDYTWVEYH